MNLLQSLCDYYDRKVALDGESLAPIGFQYKEIPFLIILDERGNFKQLKDVRDKDEKGRQNRAKALLVPQEVKRTSGQAANLLWDNPKYVLGYSNEPKKQRDAEKAHQLFIQKIRFLTPDILSLTSIKAVLTFLENNPLEVIMQDPLWEEITKAPSTLLTFRVGFKTDVVSQEPNVFLALKQWQEQNALEVEPEKQICMVTGEVDEIERVHPVIKGVLGAQTSGANIVSFNADAFNSYGKTQGANAPVGKRAAFAYTTALNHLLGKDSRQKLQLGGTTVVFWADKSTPIASALEDCFANIFSIDKTKDNPDAGVQKVKTRYISPKTGKTPVDDNADNHFFVLGLSPNAARISIRFWYVLPINHLEPNILQYFDDLELPRPFKSESGHLLPIMRLMKTLVIQQKRENISPNLEGDFFRALLLGPPYLYPWEILSRALKRIYADPTNRKAFFERASLIKVFLNRYYRSKEKEIISVELDPENRNIGYHLGRIFAVLVLIQEATVLKKKMKQDEKDTQTEKSNNDKRIIDSTICENYFGSASRTPIIAFPIIINTLTPHHLKKLKRDRPDLNRKYDEALREVTSEYVEAFQKIREKLPAKDPSYPSRLNLLEQGAFSIGYYHQRHQLLQGSKNTITDSATVEE